VKFKFLAGERVVVYATLAGVPVRSKGLVLSSYEDRIQVELDRAITSQKIIWAHPMQCRKLKKKKPTEVWICNEKIGDEAISSTFITFSDPGPVFHHEWTRFRAVKE
jgi:hypothetical protein